MGGAKMTHYDVIKYEMIWVNSKSGEFFVVELIKRFFLFYLKF